MAFAISPGHSPKMELMAELSQASWFPEHLGLVSIAGRGLASKKTSIPNFSFEESLQIIPGTWGQSDPDPASAHPAGRQSYRFTFSSTLVDCVTLTV